MFKPAGTLKERHQNEPAYSRERGGRPGEVERGLEGRQGLGSTDPGTENWKLTV